MDHTMPAGTPDLRAPHFAVEGGDAPRAERAAVPSRNRGWLVRRSLVAADVVGLITAFVVAESVVHDGSGAPDLLRGLDEYLVFLASVPAWVLLARQYGLYARDEEQPAYSTVDDVLRVFNMLSVGTWIYFVLTWAPQLAHPSVPKLVVFWSSALLIVTVGRAVARAACRRTDAYVQNTIVLGAGRVGQRVAQKFVQHPEYGVRIVGFVDDHPPIESHLRPKELPVLGTTQHLPELTRQLEVERVVLAAPGASHRKIIGLARALNEQGIHVDVVPDLFEVLDPQAEIHSAEGLALIALPPARWPRSSLVLKRALDLTIGSLALLLLLPFFAIVAVAIMVDSRGPVFFRQERIGASGRAFRIFKFRTMVPDADARKDEVAHLNKHVNGDSRMFKINGDPRTTRVGRFLRAYSFDEFPQLVNVLRGEMSLVGPRPLIPEEDRYVHGWRRKRLRLKPGMTGLWQVLGRDGIPFDEMVQLDYRYVTHWSVTNDLKLILRTLPLLRRANAG